MPACLGGPIIFACGSRVLLRHRTLLCGYLDRVLGTAFHGALDGDFHTDSGKVLNEHLDCDLDRDLDYDLHGNGSGSGYGFAQGPG